MSDAIPPTIQAPTAKERKYDRQLRLWAASGQRALEESHVILIIPEVPAGSASSVAGSETLKNLILPSIGQFTILDSAKVSESDLGINFFLEESSLGKARAEESCRLLAELNPDVLGHALVETVAGLLENPERLKSYNLILLCGPAPDATLRSISRIAWQFEIPLVYIQSIGFYSIFSVQLPPDFPIVDTHPDPDSIQDLRLLAPWKGLSDEVVALGDIEKMGDDDHAHIPYLLLLLYYLENWKDSHGGQPPANFKEKSQFRDLVRDGARTDNPEGGEENYDEAVAAVLKTINPPTVSSGVRSLFESERCRNISKTSPTFWIIAAAVKHFYDSSGVLPLPGTLPDMKARSAQYIRLQSIYRSKAKADMKQVLAQVRALEEQSGRVDKIPEAEVEAFCKNATHVTAISGSRLPLAEDYPTTAKAILSNLDNEESLIPIFLASIASLSGGGEAAITSLLESLLKATGKGGIVDSSARQRVAHVYEELTRAGGGELHNISALTGGMVAQEAIKIITRQYVPVHNTCIFDGITAKTEVLLL